MAPRSADAQFMVRITPHHEVAIAMADLARGRARDPHIRALAIGISSSQRRGNQLMRRWYGQWFGAAVPPWPAIACGWSTGAGAASFSNGLERLRSTLDLERAFLELMVPYHRMGVMMTLHGQRTSQHPELRELQAATVRVQSREIEQIKQWYAQLYAPSRAPR